MISVSGSAQLGGARGGARVFLLKQKGKGCNTEKIASREPLRIDVSVQSHPEIQSNRRAAATAMSFEAIRDRKALPLLQWLIVHPDTACERWTASGPTSQADTVCAPVFVSIVI